MFNLHYQKVTMVNLVLCDWILTRGSKLRIKFMFGRHHVPHLYNCLVENGIGRKIYCLYLEPSALFKA